MGCIDSTWMTNVPATGKGLPLLPSTDTVHAFNVGSCVHYRRVEVAVASLARVGTHLQPRQPRQKSQTWADVRPAVLVLAVYDITVHGSLHLCVLDRCKTLAPVPHRLRSEPRGVHCYTPILDCPAIACVAPCRSDGSKLPDVAWSEHGRAKKNASIEAHASPPHHCAAPTGNDGRGGAPYTRSLACSRTSV